MPVNGVGAADSTQTTLNDFIRQPQCYPYSAAARSESSDSTSFSFSNINSSDTQKKAGAGILATLAALTGLAVFHGKFKPKSTEGFTNTIKGGLHDFGKYIHDGAINIKNKVVGIFKD